MKSVPNFSKKVSFSKVLLVLPSGCFDELHLACMASSLLSRKFLVCDMLRRIIRQLKAGCDDKAAWEVSTCLPLLMWDKSQQSVRLDCLDVFT